MGEVHIASVSVDEAWARLKSDARSVLIDVRTIAEWAYVGLPDLSTVGKRPVLVEWQGFPDDRLNTAF
ncbi:MAG: rhodanese-like domain-containing protein, partial [Alphaproteobacteria bacterium]